MPLPTVTSWRALDHLLLDRIEAHAADYTDEETAKHIGPDARQRALGKVAELSALRDAIAGMVAGEAQPHDGLPVPGQLGADEVPGWNGAGASVEAQRG